MANTVIRKSTGLFKLVNIFHLSLLSVGLTQVLNSLRSRKKTHHNAVKFSQPRSQGLSDGGPWERG